MSKDKKQHKTIKLVSPEREVHVHINFIPTTESPFSPGYAYTHGAMATVGHSEIIVFGLSRDNATSILKDLLWRIVVKNEPLKVNHVYQDILAGHRAVFHELDIAKSQKYFSDHNKDDRPRKVMQLIWPDTNDLFPWETGFEETLRKLQPILGVH